MSEYRQIPSTQDLQKPVRDLSWHQKRSEDKAANELSFLERRPDLLQDLQNKTTSNYWALNIKRLQEPSQAVRTGLRYNKLEKPCYPKYKLEITS